MLQSLSLLLLLHPRDDTRLFIGLSSTGVLLSIVAIRWLDLPLWGATLLTLSFVLYPALRKWRADGQRWGRHIMVLSILLATQGFHMLEHLVQWGQYHLLGWPPKAASGLISPLNAEIIHFTWNWAVLLTVIYVLWAGLRNRWLWLLLVWAAAHTAEHTYLFLNYVAEVERLARLGLPLRGAQGLPGIVGKGGWLASHAASARPLAFLCTSAPVLRDAPRLDVHFWWNVGEISLLLVGAAQVHVGQPRDTLGRA